MRALFDLNHPAHVHLFRYVIDALEADGHDVVVTSREKDVTTDLLDAYGIEHRLLSERNSGLPSLLKEWAVRELRMLGVVRETNPDVIVGRLNPWAVHAGAVTRTPTVAVMDTKIRSPLLGRAYNAVTYPFVDTLCAPPDFDVSYNLEHYHLDYQELAYLHPDRFDPEPDLLAEHGIDAEQSYFVVRLSGLDAYHDTGYSGLSPAVRRELLAELDAHGEVYVSSPKELPPYLEEYRLSVPPHLAHQVLYHADLFVGDSGTMSTEAALLGTPAVRINSMVGIDEETVFQELEAEYGLLDSVADDREGLAVVRERLADLDSTDYGVRREAVVADRTDVTARLVEVITQTATGERSESPTERERHARRAGDAVGN
jgi:predicted glycosyltransferase